jgi:excisionase family DNA binding protein
MQGLPVREVEHYLTRAELARLMGVSVKTVDRLVAAGMPSETFGLRTRRFLASRALAWARARERQGERAAGDA